jgi:hypothetical protein
MNCKGLGARVPTFHNSLAEHMRNADQAKSPFRTFGSIDKTLPDQALYEVGGDGFEPPTPAL